MTHKKTFNIVLRSTILWILMIFMTLLLSVSALILLPFPVKLRHKIVTQWGVIFTVLAKYICKVNYIVKGLENLPKTSALIASNHQSLWETMSYNTIFPQHVWILKRELLKVPLFGWALASLMPIAINRSDPKAASQQVAEQSVARIKHGFWILVFPEGTRVKPGANAPYKTGISKIALTLNLPIIPVAHNAGYFVPKNSFCLYPGTIEVVIGKPIYPINREESPEELTERVRKAIADNLRPLIHR